jgi:hypothetical protein
MKSEFSASNFVRISVINWALTLPLLILFAWPYYYAARELGLDLSFRYIGAFMFAMPFLLTIIHGHVTMALGSIHRYRYYEWLSTKPYTFGLFFHPTLVKTRFRLIFLLVSLLFLPFGFALGV